MQTDARPNPRLVALAGPLVDKVVPLGEGEITIGRGVSNQVCISDPILSRQHCTIRRDKQQQYMIRDLGSRHGTLVNGVPIQAQLLEHGDQISLGGSVFVFQLREDEVSQQRSHAELHEGSELQGAQTLLRQEDALYLQPETSTLDFVHAGGRVARDLNTLLVIAKNISKIRDSESLAWELLGMIFDVVPADRGAILSFDI